MEDYRIWGRIEQAGDELVVIVTSVPDSGNPNGIQTLTTSRETRADAMAALSSMMVRMGQAIADRGDRVCDTEVDGL